MKRNRTGSHTYTRKRVRCLDGFIQQKQKRSSPPDSLHALRSASPLRSGEYVHISEVESLVGELMNNKMAQIRLEFEARIAHLEEEYERLATPPMKQEYYGIYS